MTTNSAGGVESYEMYDETFEAMEELGLVLNLHGEVPSNPFDVGRLSTSTSLFAFSLDLWNIRG